MTTREVARMEGIGWSHSFRCASSILVNEQSLLSEERLPSPSTFVYLYCASGNAGLKARLRALLCEDYKHFDAAEINKSTIKWLRDTLTRPPSPL